MGFAIAVLAGDDCHSVLASPRRFFGGAGSGVDAELATCPRRSRFCGLRVRGIFGERFLLHSAGNLSWNGSSSILNSIHCRNCFLSSDRARTAAIPPEPVRDAIRRGGQLFRRGSRHSNMDGRIWNSFEAKSTQGISSLKQKIPPGTTRERHSGREIFR